MLKTEQAYSQPLEVVDDKEGEEEETSENAGGSIGGGLLLRLLLRTCLHSDALCVLCPVQVSLDSRTLAGVKIGDTGTDILENLADLSVLHCRHLLLCVAFMLHQFVAAVLNSINQIVACLPCPEVVASIFSFLHCFQICRVGGSCADVVFLLDIVALVSLDKAS